VDCDQQGPPKKDEHGDLECHLRKEKLAAIGRSGFPDYQSVCLAGWLLSLGPQLAGTFWRPNNVAQLVVYYQVQPSSVERRRDIP